MEVLHRYYIFHRMEKKNQKVLQRMEIQVMLLQFQNRLEAVLVIPPALNILIGWLIIVLIWSLLKEIGVKENASRLNLLLNLCLLLSKSLCQIVMYVVIKTYIYIYLQLFIL